MINHMVVLSSSSLYKVFFIENQWRSGGARRAGRPWRQSGRSGKMGVIMQNGDNNSKNGGDSVENGGKNGRNGVVWRYQASHDFWGRKSCNPPRSPITDAIRRCWKYLFRTMFCRAVVWTSIPSFMDILCAYYCTDYCYFVLYLVKLFLSSLIVFYRFWWNTKYALHDEFLR